jgi:hypothetical protein
MHILIAQFTYTMEDDELLATAETIAPAFAEIPGCFEKTWLIDTGSKTAGGVYKFRDEAAAEAYLASELWDGVKSNPQFVHLVTRTFGVMERPTEITGGTPALAASR